MPKKVNSVTVSHLSLGQLSITELKGVGPQVAERLQKINIQTIQDLLFHLPYRYQDRTRITPIGGLKLGDYAVVEGIIALSDIVRRGRNAMLVAAIQDGTGTLSLKFFHFTASQREVLRQRGLKLRCFGEVRWGKAGYEMIHPEYRLLAQHEEATAEEALTPIYPTTEGLNQTSLRKLTEQALGWLKNGFQLEEYLPPELLKQFSLPDLNAAILYVHRPPPEADLAQLEECHHPMQLRLAFEELMAHQLSLRQLRALVQAHKAPSLALQTDLQAQFLANLSFSLTHAQQRVLQEIQQDLMLNKPMLRLVQGDVGSGKTVVAALAMLQAVGAGYQAALMAPTELLAEQHHKNFLRWLEPLGIGVAWLAGSVKTRLRKITLEQIQLGQAQIIVGTHALFQEGVNFANLGLIVVDEQHRFGVQQRLQLREKGAKENFYYPHQLVMTATPIPRTLAMTAYADLDYSVIDELPPGRTPIKTVVISNQRRDEVIERVRHHCLSGQQAYWVCTLIEESEALQCQAAEATAKLLTQCFPELRLGLVHGRLKPAEKEQIMLAFKTGEIQLLVATTVIEVGVDVPNASLMIIENAERLGLSQLHQLRGRVGRGHLASHCVLMYQLPLSHIARQRLAIIRETQDGFKIAQQDLELRGPGEVLGTRQTGLLRLRIADLMRDRGLLPAIQKAADILLQQYPERVKPLIKRWLAEGERYGNV